jgi:integral membrane protein
MNLMKSSIGRLRIIGIAEGISLLALLGIAMPLKYFAGRPEAVKIIGWMHGILFIAFIAVLLLTWLQKRWPFKNVIYGVIAAFIPVWNLCAGCTFKEAAEPIE